MMTLAKLISRLIKKSTPLPPHSDCRIVPIGVRRRRRVAARLADGLIRFDAFVLVCVRAILRAWLAGCSAYAISFYGLIIEDPADADADADDEPPLESRPPDRSPRRLRLVSTRPESVSGDRNLPAERPARHQPPHLYLVGADLRYRRPAALPASFTGKHSSPKPRRRARAPIHGFR